VESFGELMEAAAAHASAAAARLRRERLAADGISVYLDTGRYSGSPFSAGASARLARPTSSTTVLVAAARRALEACYRPGPLYAKCGVMLYGITGAAGIRDASGGLFGEGGGPRGREDALMLAVDAVNAKYGKGSLRVLSEGRGGAPPWAMRRARLSPVSTTDWGGLPRVKA
jgi:DNA polymerase V